MRALFPGEDCAGVMHGIREQILADALEAVPPPRTLLELLLIIEREFRPRARRGSIALELLATLRQRALEAPDRTLDELLAREEGRPRDTDT